jgi:hypothetical protein
MGYPDPAKASGSEGFIIEAFRSVRNDMFVQLPDLLDEILT